MAFARSLLLAGGLWLAHALAIPLSPRVNDAPVTYLTTSQISAITPFAEFTAISYCSHAAVMSWSCGSLCAALPGVVTLVTGGDNNETPDYYVAYYPSESAIVVAHQGTNTSSLLSLLDDGEAVQVPIDPEYFPAPNLLGVTVHAGFQATFERSAAIVLAAVQSGIITYGATQVYVVGHSLGAAIAVFDALYLKEQLPSTIPITTTLFGLPRVGNPLFASYVDAQLPGQQHLTNYNDIVPHLPPVVLVYEHPTGEIWIQSNGVTYDACPGQENENCADSIPLVETSATPHDGPYAGIMMGSAGCTA